VGCNAQPSGYTHGYYSRLLPQLVRTWRELFGVRFAALVVQLAAYGSTDATPAQRSSDGLPLLREAQRSVYEAPPSGLVHPIDTADNGLNVPLWTPTTCGEHGGIHPRNKTEVGRRLALRLAVIEGVLPAGAIGEGPRPGSASQSGGVVTLALDAATSPGVALVPTADCETIGNVKQCCQSAASGAVSYPFELRLADNSTYIVASAALQGGDAAPAVTLAPVDATQKGPFTGVRYAWQGVPLCSVTNAGSLPMGPFVINI